MMVQGFLADSFDLLNVRDLDLIAQAAGRCSGLVVGVFTDDYASAVLGSDPVVPLAERLALVQHVRGVAAALPFDGTWPSGLARVEVFVAADRPTPPWPSSVLTPRRATSSPILARALGLVEEAVA